jgi:hypothetical protein
MAAHPRTSSVHHVGWLMELMMIQHATNLDLALLTFSGA